MRNIAIRVVKKIILDEIHKKTGGINDGLGPRGGSKRVTTGGRFTGGTGRGIRARDRATSGPGIEGANYRGPRG